MIFVKGFGNEALLFYKLLLSHLTNLTFLTISPLRLFTLFAV